jgi:hypothetical protein
MSLVSDLTSRTDLTEKVLLIMAKASSTVLAITSGSFSAGIGNGWECGSTFGSAAGVYEE